MGGADKVTRRCCEGAKAGVKTRFRGTKGGKNVMGKGDAGKWERTQVTRERSHFRGSPFPKTALPRAGKPV